MINQPLLKVRNLSKRFGGVIAVHEVSFDVYKNEVLGLIGPNGAGKTTVFNLISGFISWDSGEVIFDENSLTGMRPDQICKHGMTRTFQIVKPFSELSVLDNVMVGALNRCSWGPEAKSLALAVTDFMGLYKYRNDSAARLPLALRKRVEIARALATKPKLLLLDEVLSGQNPGEVKESLKMIHKICQKNITIIMIEHVMSAIMDMSHRIIVLNYGKKIAEGAPHEIILDKNVLDAYLGNEFSLESV